ncbi:pYEATS domain-containing protein [Ensifer sp. Root127]|uniref:pYEATS domain-containing protein n=1 Tax=Ensifer sp. Root127 TaxID=1736440 RepID=UPI00070A91EC|nr:pYEATS domain-containing protein [Ensifer sp. Root127]KQW72470.1 hypothetical protein ASD03_32515 [Ensifer sp. Root127]
MTSTLNVIAPADMSIGRIRIFGRGAQVGAWLATPATTSCQFKLRPGAYTATIEPLGQITRSFSFLVEGDHVVREVQVPSLRQLAASGELFLRTSLTQAATSAVEQEDEQEQDNLEVKSVAHPKRWLSVAISQDTLPGRVGGWRPYWGKPEPQLTVSAGLAEILIESPASVLDAAHSRLRLECAVSGLRNERLMIPLFKGGTKVVLRSSPTASDIGVLVFPVELRRRALVQALYAGTVDEAKQIVTELLGSEGETPTEPSTEETDPWLEIVIALLNLRFPELQRFTSREKIDDLVSSFEWIPDVHALSARRYIDTASPDERNHEIAGLKAVQSMARCRRLGIPYFTYTAQLVGDMLNALSKAEMGTVSEKAALELKKWQLRIPTQKTAGAIFSWLVTGSKLQLAIGSIDERFSRVIFRGRLDPGRIGMQSPLGKNQRGDSLAPRQEIVMPSYSDDGVLLAPTESLGDITLLSGELLSRVKSYHADPAALSLPILRANDPHKGRWGGLASKNGYALSAEFITLTPEHRSWVTVVLTVDAAPDFIEGSYDLPVEFFLHPTFNPDRVRTTFSGHRARLELGCYGGFTVGAWIPSAEIELELDLGEIEDAPYIIKHF